MKDVQDSRKTKRRTALRAGLAVVVALVLSYAAITLVLVMDASQEPERIIARFEAAASQADANELTRLIQWNPGLTHEQVKRILRLLLEPEVVTRPAYPVGTFPEPIVRHRFSLDFHNMRVLVRRDRVVDGHSTNIDTWRTLAAPRGPTSVSTRLTEPGVHRFELQYDCSFTGGAKMVWRWDPFKGTAGPARRLFPMRVPKGVSPPRNYNLSFTVPIDITVADPKTMEPMPLVSDPALDRAVRGAFVGYRYVKRDCHYAMPAGDRWHDGWIAVEYKELPVAVAFDAVLELPGRPTLQRRCRLPHRLRARAGAAGEFEIWPAEYRLEAPGEYKGTLVLKPDPNCAYEDPRIETIWNGTLEFPFHFTITDQPPPDWE